MADRDPLADLLVQYGKECENKPECGLRDEGGAAHGCKCVWCRGFRKLQSKIKALNRKRHTGSVISR